MNADFEKVNNEKDEALEKQNGSSKNDRREVTSAIDHWLSVNHQLRTQKIVSIGVAFVGFIFLGLTLFEMFRPPLVVFEGEKGRIPYLASSKKLNIDEEQIQRFVTEFLYLYNKWEKLEPNDIAKQIEPYTSDELLSKIKDILNQRKNRDFKGREVSQDIAHLKVQVSEKAIVASFDKVLHLNSIPLIVPTQVSFQLTNGNSTKWNPLGLYVNGILEHEGSEK